MGPNAVTALIKGDEKVARLLDSFCAGECDHTWACDGCPIALARRTLEWSLSVVRVDALNKTLTPEEVRRTFHVGKRQTPY
ncbi:hypothetical protein GCM10025857_07250 [Alicyclobacillus contaminans]|nr:hypothetical protein GCM10025857_07250 [Alicyclobacillus contaminans]